MASISSVLKEFDSYYKDCTSIKLPSVTRKRFELRASGLPFCALRMAQNRYSHEHNDKWVVHDEFGMSFFTSVGTIAHEVFQRFTGAGGRMYGNWKCAKCGKKRKCSTDNKCVCGHEMAYEELTVKIGKYFSGHVDGVYVDSKGRYFVIDYKTSTQNAIYASPSKLPYTYNKAQIKAYAGLLEREYGITISGWMLVYISRDNPFGAIKVTGSLISEKSKQANVKKLLRYDRHYGYLRNTLTKQTLIRIIDEKPCVDMDHYETDYAGHNPCPMAATCFEGRKALFRASKHLIGQEWASAPEGVYEWTNRRSGVRLNKLNVREQM